VQISLQLKQRRFEGRRRHSFSALLSFFVHFSDQIGRVEDHFFGFVMALIVAVFGSWFTDAAAEAAAAGVLFAFFSFL
jgi:hypothetical protein